MTRSKSRKGFTLVEMMTTLVISAFVTMQVVVMVSSTQDSYFGQKGALESQIDARLVTDLVMRDVRPAGFLVPSMTGISSGDGGATGLDRLCTSDTSVFDESFIDDASEPVDGASLLTALGAVEDVVDVADTQKDIDADGDEDFVEGSGIIISDGVSTHCARIESLGVDSIQFAPATPSGFGVAVSGTRAIPAFIYVVDSTGLLRNGVLVSAGVEDFQVEFGVDTSGDEIVDPSAGEFPIHDLNTSGSSEIEYVRVSVLVRSAAMDPGVSSAGRPALANRTASGIADSFRRRTVSAIWTPRNL